MTAVLNGIWQSLVVTLVVAMALRFAKGLNASTRYAIWWITLGTTVALLAVNAGISIIPRSAPAERVMLETQSQPEPLAAPAGIEAIPLAMTPTTMAQRTRFEPVQIRWNWIPFTIGVLWIGAAVVMLARVGLGVLLLVRISREATEGPDADLGRMRVLIRECGVRRSVGFGVSKDLRTPVAAGLYRAKVLIPSALIGRLSEQEFDQVAIHELAHLKRWDDWANLIQRFIGALLVFCPAIWIINKKLDLEREIACDDFVLEQTGRARDYAACLTRLVEMSGWARRAGLATGLAQVGDAAKIAHREAR
jgi:beta-lactamase regulating signal transducer with metallopeptidase domain